MDNYGKLNNTILLMILGLQCIRNAREMQDENYKKLGSALSSIGVILLIISMMQSISGIIQS